MCVGVSARNLSLIDLFYFYTKRSAEIACVSQQKGIAEGDPFLLFAER